MKHFLLIVLLLNAGVAMAGELTIRVTNIDVDKGGNISVYIFGKDGFPTKNEKALVAKSQRADKQDLEFVFNFDFPEVAIKAHHDEDGNGKTTKNWTGIIPAEGLGFSKGQKIGLFGPPTYKKTKLLREELLPRIEIEIIYP